MKNHLLIVITTTLALSACKPDGADTATPPTNPPTGSTNGSPVETNPPNSTYQPAFASQTRTAGVKTTSRYEARILTRTLTSPWGITSLPDGRLLVTEKAGTMRIVTSTGALSGPIQGLPQVNPAGQGGLLGLRVDPDFATNRLVYWVFSEPLAEGNVTAVAKGRLATDETRIEGATVIYRATPGLPGHGPLWRPNCV